MTTSSEHLPPAERLAGRQLANSWSVVRRIERQRSATGGSFSTSYIVRSQDGREAFLKAMDYHRALQSADPAGALQLMTTAYTFERRLLQRCIDRKLSRIVRVLDFGTIPAVEGDPSSVVEYLIFELAHGDIRSFMERIDAYESAWTLRTIHEVAAAIQQLHSVRIAHQDLKPSNVLIFEQDHSKLADLGRAADADGVSPHDELQIAGDRSYAPPELLYGQVSVDWVQRRLGCDMYLFGSLIVFFCMGVSITHLLLARLPRQMRPGVYGGTYAEILPQIEHEFSNVVRELKNEIHVEYADEIVRMVKQLCNPDPERRGHPRSIISSGNQYSLERYVSILGNLARRAEYSLRSHEPFRREEKYG